MDFELTVPIVKSDEELRVVYGWASVIEQNGETVIDRQGDSIAPQTLVKAAHALCVNYTVESEGVLITD